MNLPKQLLISLPPKINESQPGYILRITEVNCYESNTYIYGLLGANNDRRLQFVSEEESIKLSNLTNVNHELLEELSFLNSNQENVSKLFLHMKKGKVCELFLEKGILGEGVKRLKRKSSQWRISQIAIIAFIGVAIGSLIVKVSLISILGALSGSLLLVVINLVYVIYTNRKSKTDKNTNT
ncbi:hypothetical protein PY093_05170 [Cytobacillus sp. S13-E01]|uniref:hypothetical protein n=1 Tax=Cytobacillus sp. S13-E01 TaxID=3031326 RepID=UPI0023D8022A|nr:hypothetical protein [Cytobacillus sp. S13-E01]MDF0726104.1 hypothetical protein [Cytobacillus sp. S13-E01]